MFLLWGHQGGVGRIRRGLEDGDALRLDLPTVPRLRKEVWFAERGLSNVDMTVG